MIKMLIEHGLFIHWFIMRLIKHWFIMRLIKHIIELWLTFMMLLRIEDLMMVMMALLLVFFHVRLEII